MSNEKADIEKRESAPTASLQESADDIDLTTYHEEVDGRLIIDPE